MKIMAIDPGNIESAYCTMFEDYRPLNFEKIDNLHLAELLESRYFASVDRFVIERVACYGMPVGREVFNTCEWIGRFTQIILSQYGRMPHYILRMDEKMEICHDVRAGDSNIRRALIDRFAQHDLKNGKGTKKNPDFFYGFAKDIWAAYAVGYTYIQRMGREAEEDAEKSRGL